MHKILSRWIESATSKRNKKESRWKKKKLSEKHFEEKCTYGNTIKALLCVRKNQAQLKLSLPLRHCCKSYSLAATKHTRHQANGGKNTHTHTQTMIWRTDALHSMVSAFSYITPGVMTFLALSAKHTHTHTLSHGACSESVCNVLALTTHQCRSGRITQSRRA